LSEDGCFREAIYESQRPWGCAFLCWHVVEAAWAIVEPVIHGPSPMYEYEPGTWGPKEADKLVEGVGGWNTR
jgi:glucose-6-phosphate 1-dehydrogenase